MGCLLPPGRQETIRTEVATSGLFVGRKIGLILAQPQPSHHILGSLNVSQNHLARRQIVLLFRSAQQKFLILCLENKSWKLNSVNFVEMHFFEVEKMENLCWVSHLSHSCWWQQWLSCSSAQTQILGFKLISGLCPAARPGPGAAQTHKNWWKLP